MFQQISRISILLLSVFALSYGLPGLFDKVFLHDAGNPLLFYSPLKEQFIYRESLGGHQFNYRDESGTDYDRAGFEAQLPFFYYKNLEKKKKLPVTVQGQFFDKKAIKSGKQGYEVRSRHLAGNYPQIALYPLFNNNPELPIIPFPEDVFRFTDKGMEFISADFNRIDSELTASFTAALAAEGFSFPATAIGGKTTNLKPFDEGYFVRDSKGYIFHIKRVLNQPVVVKTPISPELDVVALIISENRRKEFYGSILTRESGIYLIGWNDYRLLKLPVENYDPRAMDLKLLVTPLSKTVVIGDEEVVRGTVFDQEYTKTREYTLNRLDRTPALIRIFRQILFPFHISLNDPYRGKASPRFTFGGLWSLLGVVVALVTFYFVPKRRNFKQVGLIDSLVVLLAGLYGLLSVLMIRRE